MNKYSLRQKMLKELAGLTPSYKFSSAEIIFANLRKKYFSRKGISRIMLYYPLANEPNIFQFCNAEIARELQLKFYLPKIVGEELKVFSTEKLVKNPNYNFMEPDDEICLKLNSQNLDLICVPGLAFARQKFNKNSNAKSPKPKVSGGNEFAKNAQPRNVIRLGRGGGFYDRLLGKLDSSNSRKCVAVGICFQCQVLGFNGFPLENHDKNLDDLIFA